MFITLLSSFLMLHIQTHTYTHIRLLCVCVILQLCLVLRKYLRAFAVYILTFGFYSLFVTNNG